MFGEDDAVRPQQRDDLYLYYQRENAIQALAPGNGYWCQFDSQLTVTVDTLLTGPVTVALSRAEEGWNQVASPYVYPILWTGGGTLWRSTSPLVRPNVGRRLCSR